MFSEKAEQHLKTFTFPARGLAATIGPLFTLEIRHRELEKIVFFCCLVFFFFNLWLETMYPSWIYIIHIHMYMYINLCNTFAIFRF